MAETSEMVERVRRGIEAAWADWNQDGGRGRSQADVPVELLARAAIVAHAAALAETEAAEIRADAEQRRKALRAKMRGPATRFAVR